MVPRRGLRRSQVRIPDSHPSEGPGLWRIGRRAPRGGGRARRLDGRPLEDATRDLAELYDQGRAPASGWRGGRPSPAGGIESMTDDARKRAPIAVERGRQTLRPGRGTRRCTRRRPVARPRTCRRGRARAARCQVWLRNGGRGHAGRWPSSARRRRPVEQDLPAAVLDHVPEPPGDTPVPASPAEPSRAAGGTASPRSRRRRAIVGRSGCAVRLPAPRSPAHPPSSISGQPTSPTHLTPFTRGSPGSNRRAAALRAERPATDSVHDVTPRPGPVVRRRPA